MKKTSGDQLMNENQLEGQSNETKQKGKSRLSLKKPGGDKNTEQKSKTGKQGDKSGTVLGKINDDSKKKNN